MISEGKQAAIEQTMRDFRRFFSLGGGLVLEIGARGNAAADRLLDMGAQAIICSNLVRNAEVEQSDRVHYVRTDATATAFRPKAFDVVFGRAILEHLNPMSGLRDEIARLLKPGGVFYLDGGPMWCSPKGHHLWLRAPSGRQYTFSDTDCPVHDWEHLLLSEADMVGVLKKRGVDDNDVKAIADYVYRAEGQNRVPPSAICDTFQAEMVLDVAILKDVCQTAPPACLVGQYGKDDLTTTRVVIAGRKRDSTCQTDTLAWIKEPSIGTAPEPCRQRMSIALPRGWHLSVPPALATYVARRHPRLAGLYIRMRRGRSKRR